MSEQLQSLKYLPAEYLEPEPTAEAPVRSAATAAPSPYASPTPVTSTATSVGTESTGGKWTTGMGIVSGFISFAGGLGVIQGLWAIWTLFQLEDQIATVSALASRMPNLADSVAMLEAQLANWNLLMISAVFGLIVSVGFLASAYMYSKRKENGNLMIAVFCIMAVVYHMLTMYVSYLCLAGMPSFEGPEGAMGLKVAMGAVAFILMIKAAVYLSITAYMFTKNSRALFANSAAA